MTVTLDGKNYRLACDFGQWKEFAFGTVEALAKIEELETGSTVDALRTIRETLDMGEAFIDAHLKEIDGEPWEGKAANLDPSEVFGIIKSAGALENIPLV